MVQKPNKRAHVRAISATTDVRAQWTWVATLALLSLVALAIAGTSARAESTTRDSWTDLRPDVFGDRPIMNGGKIVTLEAPYRPEDQRRVPVRIKADLRDGRTISKVWFIVDNNPMPVAAEFTMGKDRTKVDLAMEFRFNEQTYTRAVVEASDGTLYMQSQLVKYAGGQSACSAPPEGDPAEIIANMGKMNLTHKATKVAASQLRPKATLELSHPVHTGMVLDQMTLLYVLMNMVEEIEVTQGDERVFNMKGTITIAQNPKIDFDYRVNGATKLHVVSKDTNKNTWKQSFPINQGS